MKIFKKTLRILLFTLIGLLIASAILPYLFKDKIIAFIKDDINKSIDATVEFKDAGLTIWGSFPNVGIYIEELKLTGKNNFDGIVLYEATNTTIDLSLVSLFGDRVPTINGIDLQSPVINIYVLNQDEANYLITSDTTNNEKSAFTIKLSSFNVSDADFNYNDLQTKIKMQLNGINASGKGDFTQDIFDLKLNTKVDTVDFYFEDMAYITKGNANFKGDININLPENKYTLLENNLTLNELPISADGFVQFVNENDINIDISFDTKSQPFKSFLSVIPYAFTKDFDKVTTKGNASVAGKVNGIFNSETLSYPSFDIGIDIKDGMVKYPNLPASIQNINTTIKVAASKSDLNDLVIDIPKFSLNLGSDRLEGKLIASNLQKNQNVSGLLICDLDLKNLKNALPLQEIQLLKGNLNSNIVFSGSMLDINNENYQSIKCEGKASLANLEYQSNGFPKIASKSIIATANPDRLNINLDQLTFGRSDVKGNIDIRNPLALFSTNKKIIVKVTGSSNLVDLGEWETGTSNNKKEVQPTVPIMVDDRIVKESQIEINYVAKAIKMEDLDLNNLNLLGKVAANQLGIENMSVSIGESDLKINGTVENAYDYLFSQKMLTGMIKISSNYLDLNQFMDNSSTNSASNQQQLSVIKVPENVNLTLIANVNKVQYTNLSLQNVTGNLQVVNQEVSLSDLQTSTLGGNIALQGLYSTLSEGKPYFNVKLDLSKIKFAEAIKGITILEKIAPIAKYIEGYFNTTLTMSGNLGESMVPELSTLDASGFIETLSGNIKGFTPLGKLADKLGLSDLREISLKNTKNWFEIVDGFLKLDEFDHTISGINLKIGGQHGFGKDMNYLIKLTIPREKLKGNNVTALAESGLTLIEKEAKKIGLDINQGPNLFVDVQITGQLTNPNFIIKPKSSSGSSLGQNAVDKLQDGIGTLRDSVNRVIDNKKQQIQDSIQKRANQEIENVKDKISSEGQKQIDSIKSKTKEIINDKIDSLVSKSVGDSLVNKATDLLKNNSEVDKIKDKLKNFDPFKKKGKG